MAEANGQPVKPTLGVGNTCRWWRDLAARNGGQTGTAAIVTSSRADGVLTLALWPANATLSKYARGCRHADDPWFHEHPGQDRANGVWDFLEPPVRPAPPQSKYEEKPEPATLDDASQGRVFRGGQKSGKTAPTE